MRRRRVPAPDFARPDRLRRPCDPAAPSTPPLSPLARRARSPATSAPRDRDVPISPSRRRQSRKKALKREAQGARRLRAERRAYIMCTRKFSSPCLNVPGIVVRELRQADRCLTQGACGEPFVVVSRGNPIVESGAAPSGSRPQARALTGNLLMADDFDYLPEECSMRSSGTG